MGGRNVGGVFYAESYHPIQSGSIDGTDVAPHDKAILRALLTSKHNLYDPFGDPKVIGDPYCTVFVGRLSRQTDESTIRKAMSKYGKIKNMRLVRDIVTGASRGYAFVEYESEKEMRNAYLDAHHSMIDDSEVIVDYYRQQLMPGWIPRRLGGGLGGKKESGQLRFGGRERPFRAPLRPIPYDDLKKLGIPLPPEGHYMTRYEVPSLPRRKRSCEDIDEPIERRSQDREDAKYMKQEIRSSRWVTRPEDWEGGSPRKHEAEHSQKRIRSKDLEERRPRRSESDYYQPRETSTAWEDDNSRNRESGPQDQSERSKEHEYSSSSKRSKDRGSRSSGRERSEDRDRRSSSRRGREHSPCRERSEVREYKDSRRRGHERRDVSKYRERSLDDEHRHGSHRENSSESAGYNHSRRSEGQETGVYHPS